MKSVEFRMKKRVVAWRKGRLAGFIGETFNVQLSTLNVQSGAMGLMGRRGRMGNHGTPTFRIASSRRIGGEASSPDKAGVNRLGTKRRQASALHMRSEPSYVGCYVFWGGGLWLLMGGGGDYDDCIHET